MEPTEVAPPTSAQLLYAEREQRIKFLPQEPLVSTIYDAKAADFNGSVDGGGIKQVMTDPKTPIELIPPQFIEQVAAVLLYGKAKYAANNWMRGMSYATVFGGVMRHMWAWFRGEEIDPVEKGGSGLPHLAHAACGIMFLLWFTQGPREAEYSKTDDRVFKQEQ